MWIKVDQNTQYSIRDFYLTLTPTHRLSSLKGPAGSDALVPRLSFSAALTRPMRSAGTIVFNEIFVNEEGAYNPRTGEIDALSMPILKSLQVQVLDCGWSHADVSS